MAPDTSPDDPVFFLHHCFVDKIWAEWQSLQRKNWPEQAPHYAPLMDGAPGHNIDDEMKPWGRTVREVLDIATLGYQYEVEAFVPMALDVQIASAIEFGRFSPFWAD